MEKKLYMVKIDNQIVALGMELDVALLLIQAWAGKYYNETLHAEIVEMERCSSICEG